MYSFIIIILSDKIISYQEKIETALPYKYHGNSIVTLIILYIII